MIADRMTLGDDPADDFGVFRHLGTDQEEGRGNLVLGQQVEQRRGVLGGRAVIERQADLSADASPREQQACCCQ